MGTISKMSVRHMARTKEDEVIARAVRDSAIRSKYLDAAHSLTDLASRLRKLADAAELTCLVEIVSGDKAAQA